MLHLSNIYAYSIIIAKLMTSSVCQGSGGCYCYSQCWCWDFMNINEGLLACLPSAKVAPLSSWPPVTPHEILQHLSHRHITAHTVVAVAQRIAASFAWLLLFLPPFFRCVIQFSVIQPNKTKHAAILSLILLVHIKIVWCLRWAAHCTEQYTHIFSFVKM